MAHVNLIGHYFFNKFDGRIITGFIKEFPEDFEVTELHDIDKPVYIMDKYSFYCSNLIKNRLSDPMSDDKRLITVEPVVIGLLSTKAAFTDELKISLQMLNDTWIDLYKKDTNHSFQKIIVPYMNDKELRQSFHFNVKILYPFLKTDVVETNASNQIPREKSIEVSIDDCFLSLLNTNIPTDDVKLLYKFKNRGPQDEFASQGIIIGIDLDRKTRTTFYQIMTSQCKSLDSKTIDINGKKCMLVHWRQKALNMKPKSKAPYKDFVTPQDTSSGKYPLAHSVASASHIWFHLCKRDIEQLEAARIIASSLGISPGDVSFAGIKDRRAITYQRASIAVHVPLPSHTISRKRPRAQQSQSQSLPLAVKDGKGTDRASRSDVRTETDVSFGDDVDATVVKTRRLEELAQKLLALQSATTTTIPPISQPLSNPEDFTVHGATTTTTTTITSAAVAASLPSTSSLSIGDIAYCTRSINIGELWGNRFNIVLRHLHSPPNDNNNNDSSSSSSHLGMQTTTASISENNNLNTSDDATSGIPSLCASQSQVLVQQLSHRLNLLSHPHGSGFPNFFGSQRMGLMRTPTTTPSTTTPSTTTTIASTTTDRSIDSTSTIMHEDRTLPQSSPSLLPKPLVRNPSDSLNDELPVTPAIAPTTTTTTTTTKIPSGPSIGKYLLMSDYKAAVFQLMAGDACCPFVESLWNSQRSAKSSRVAEPVGVALGVGEGEGEGVAGSRATPSVSELGNGSSTPGSCDHPMCQARCIFLRGGSPANTIKEIPWKYSRERMVMQGLVRYGTTAYQRALLLLPHNIRTLWMHAYQSWIWNRVASYRLEKHGGRAVAGDLILVENENGIDRTAEVEGVAEVTALKTGGSSAQTKVTGAAVRAVTSADILLVVEATETETEAARGSGGGGGMGLAHRVVLPVFGTHVQYPCNDVGRYYLSLLQSEGFDISDCNAAHNIHDNTPPPTVSSVAATEDKVVAAEVEVEVDDWDTAGNEFIEALDEAVFEGEDLTVRGEPPFCLSGVTDIAPTTTSGTVTDDSKEMKPPSDIEGSSGSLATDQTTTTPSPSSPSAIRLPRGTYRKLLQYAYNASVSATTTTAINSSFTTGSAMSSGEGNSTTTPPDARDTDIAVSLSFSLRSGVFATALLRELLHHNDVI